MKNFSKNRGFSILELILLGIIVLLVLGYFNISVRGVVNSPTTQDNLNYVAGGTETLWDKYLAEPAHYLWQDVWVNIFWKGFISNMERIRDGQPTDFDKAAANLQVH